MTTDIAVWKPPHPLKQRWNEMVRGLQNAIMDSLIYFGACISCYSFKDVQPEPSRTQYHWNGIGENPNADKRLCRTCAASHHKYWDEMWREYYSSRI